MDDQKAGGRLVLVSLRGTSRRRENRAGLPADAGAFLVLEAVESVWRRGLDLDGSRTVLGARGSDFRFLTEAPGQPCVCLADGEGEETVRRCRSRRRSKTRSTSRSPSGWPRWM